MTEGDKAEGRPAGGAGRRRAHRTVLTAHRAVEAAVLAAQVAGLLLLEAGLPASGVASGAADSLLAVLDVIEPSRAEAERVLSASEAPPGA